ncbi:protein Fmp42p [[Candida] jaroonii]|uniref:Protein Fmp42p n=1 Tax=[Candida] jaroonii TaxID=467808 RepID=A0ACA9Y6U7_9ASCO|nr:protein Fmp42p [[Candida] jaroonii]
MIYTDVSSKRRFIQCCCAIFWCLLSGGPIFGFAALKPILIKQGIYEEVCNVGIEVSDLVMESQPTFTNMLLGKVFALENDTVAKCTNQDLKLNMMFTVGAVVTNVSALVIGSVLDRYGPKVCGLIGAFFLYFACFIFIYADNITDSFISSFFDPYLIGYASMALGGPFAYISSFQLSNSFPKKSGSVLALLTGAFDSSSALFLIFRIVYNKTQGSFSIEDFFKVYLLVPVFITVAQIFVMEWDSYKTPPDTTLCVDDHQPTEEQPLLEPSHRRRDSIGDALKQPYAEEGEANLVKYSGGIFGILHGYSAKYQMKTPWFYLMCLFATIQMLRLNYFVATINTQYTYLLHSISSAEALTKFFDLALPLGGVISIPFVGLFLDYCSTVLVLNALLAVSLLIGVLGCIGNYYTGIINVCIFVGYRPFFYTAVSDFCAKVFGFDTFGTVYGAIICTSGIFNFSQSILDKLTHTSFNMNPVPINIILVCLTVLIGGITVTYVRIQAGLYNQRKQAQLNSQ